MALALQRAFEDLGTPLADTTFCVLDLETTGGSPADSRITEIGAVKVRGGEVLGEFASLVNPGVPIPPFIIALTGITEAMVADAAPIEEVVPSFLEFVGDSVLVAHNAAFDTRFLQSSLARLGYPALENPVVCTMRLARRLVRDEVPNLRLETLAAATGARTAPSHRALADARAARDVLHALIEVAGRWGVTHIDDLLWLQGARGHPQYRKVRLTDSLPRERGVYLFRDSEGALLYVGKAANLRARVRSYFSSDDRRSVGDLLRELARVDHILCETDLEATVVEARLIRRETPPYNHALLGRRRSVSLTLTRERFPRLVVSRTPDASLLPEAALGPLGSTVAATVREALEEVGGMRTCSTRIGPKTRFDACLLARLGRCGAPCEGRQSPEEYAARIEPVRAALARDAAAALEVLAERIDRLVAQRRFEDATATRDRVGALVAAVSGQRAVEALRAAGRLRLEVDGVEMEVAGGALERIAGAPLAVPADGHPDEPRLIAAWLARNRASARLVQAENPYELPVAGGRALAEWSRRLGRAQRAEARGRGGNARRGRARASG